MLWEICQLADLGRIEIDLEAPSVVRALRRVQTWPLDLAVCRQSGRLDVRVDPADALIAATSIVHQVPLVTRDRVLRRSKLILFHRTVN